MTQILRNQTELDHRDSVVVDFYLLVPSLILAEALIDDYRLKKALIRLLDYCIKNKIKFGRANLLSWLERVNYPHIQEVRKLLQTTPLGNPVWWLFATSHHHTLKLIKDLDTLICQTTCDKPRSLKSIVRDFIYKNPEYGNAEKVSTATGRSKEDILAEWQPQWTSFKGFHPTQDHVTKQWIQWNILGDLATRLITLQSAAVPKSKYQKIAEHLRANPDTDPSKIKIEKDEFPLHRPAPVLYGVAFRDFLIGVSKLPKECWEEMADLYMQTHCTNFLAFAPILLQPFARSDLNLPVPTISTLATFMGDYTGATGTFMGDLTKNNKQVRWKTLGLTIGKLCEKTGRLPEVKLQNSKLEVSSDLNATTRICGNEDELTETPEIGEDRGWVVVGEDLLRNRWNTTLTDIKESLVSNKITYNKFPIVRESLLFTTRRSLTCLNHWSNKQCKQGNLCQLIGDPGEWFNRLPSTQGRATQVFSVFPSLTYTLRQEQKKYRQNLKRVLSDLASTTEVVTKRCGRSECPENFVSSDLRRAPTQQASYTERVGESPPASGTAWAPSKPKSSYVKNSEVRSATHSLESISTQRVAGKANDEMFPCKVSIESSKVYSKPGESTSTTCKDMAVGAATIKIPCLTPLHSQKPWCRSGSDTMTYHGTESEYPHAGCTNECTSKPSCNADSRKRTIMLRVREESIYPRFFIAETFKEDRNKKQIVSRLRQRRLEVLQAQERQAQLQSEIKTMDNAHLHETISQMLLELKASETTKGQRDLDNLKAQLDEYFAEYALREMGMTFPNLQGTKTPEQLDAEGVTEPLSFRYWLGDEEVIAIEKWHEIVKQDHSLPSPPATRAVRRIWAAMTYLWVAKYFTEIGKQWVPNDMWDCFEYKRFPLMEADVTAAYSLIPYIHWVEAKNNPDVFRKKKPDMDTHVWCPAFRLNHQLYSDIVREKKTINFQPLKPLPEPESETYLYDIDIDEEEIPNFDSHLFPMPLSKVAVSSLSLCSLTDWHPDNILREAERFFDKKYSLELHPTETQYHRLYVKLGVQMLDKRLNNHNLARFSCYFSPLFNNQKTEDGIDPVVEIYTNLRKQLNDWYDEFQRDFTTVWKKVGDSWISFIDEETEHTIGKKYTKKLCHL